MRRSYDPDRSPLVLRLVVLGYFVWWFLPIVAGIRVAFTEGNSATIPVGFSWQWVAAVFGKAGFRGPLVHSLRLAALTSLIATPLGVATAIGLHRWNSLTSRIVLGVVVVAVAVPQIVLAVALFLTSVELTPIRLGAGAQLLAHITLALPFVVLIVWVSLDRLSLTLEESAMDLGAKEGSVLRRVTLPQITPALLAAAAVAWLLSFDNIVLSSWLCILSDCATIPMRLYGRGTPRAAPIHFAYGTIMLVFMIAGVLVTVPWLRWFARSRPAR